MFKKLLSVISLLLLSGGLSGQSFAENCEQSEVQIVSNEKEVQLDEAVKKLISETVELATKVLGSVTQNVSANKDGNVYITKSVFRAGAEKARIGEKFIINKEAFRQWIKNDRSELLNSLACRRLNFWGRNLKLLLKNMAKLKEHKGYDDFIDSYVAFILDGEYKIANGELEQIKKSKTGFFSLT